MLGRLIGLLVVAVVDDTFSPYRFEENEAPGARSFFTEIIASISDIKFGKDGRHILSRDYMTLKVYGYSYSSVKLLTAFFAYIFFFL